MLSLGPSDVLILAGASWRHDASALAKSKNACGFKLVCLIYDLLPIDYPSLVTVRQRELYKKFLCDIGGAADLIVTPNLVTASQLKSFLSEKCISPGPIASISVSGAGLSQEPGEPGPRLHALGLPEKKFMLCVSALRERKHILWLYALCARLHQDQPGFPLLVIAGSAACVNILRILSDDPAWGRAGVFIEDPADAELAWLYQNAQICLQPAFEGGLGMTVIEAINYGRHCIAADAPSLVDSGGGFAEHLPRDEALWTNAIRRILDIEAGLNPANTSHLPPASSPGILAQIRTLLETDGKLLNKKMEQPAVL
jgi:glycosyltransferase involved in cell wall biosynthesis